MAVLAIDGSICVALIGGTAIQKKKQLMFLRLP